MRRDRATARVKSRMNRFPFAMNPVLRPGLKALELERSFRLMNLLLFWNSRENGSLKCPTRNRPTSSMWIPR